MSDSTHQHLPENAQPRRERLTWIPELLLIVVLALSAYLRFSGINWDDNSHPHPDERFLTMVESAIRLPTSLGEYFNSELSPLNPHNAGHGFFVYGTLPIFIVRYIAEALGQTGYDQVHLVGRAASAVFDLISIALVYLIGSELYRKRVGLLAAAFTGFSVLLIQLSHFWVVDPFANTFILAGFYMALRALKDGRTQSYLLFGVFLGMAMASKVSALPLAAVIVLAAFIRVWRAPLEARQDQLQAAFKGVLGAALISLLTFRIFQPYAFVGSTFFDVRLNPKWLSNLSELRNYSAGTVDFPPAWQWADRAKLFFSLGNLVIWGMGIPLGVAAWLSWGWALWRMRQGEWQPHLIPVVWTAGYFIWQSISFTKSMRYQLPVYPTLSLLAAWGFIYAWDRAGAWRSRWSAAARGLVAVTLTGTLLATIVWAFAFASIYTRAEPRVAASRWMYTHLPGPANLVVANAGERLLEPIPVSSDRVLDPAQSLSLPFRSHLDGEVIGFEFPHLTSLYELPGAAELLVELRSSSQGSSILAQVSAGLEFDPENSQSVQLTLSTPVEIHAGETYTLELQLLSGGGLKLGGSVIISETSWDLGLPARIDGRDGFGGLYLGVNQEIYWPDNADDNHDGVPDKLDRLLQTLEQGDYLAISSNRQYASLTRVPEKYPLTIAYYRALIGCPLDEQVWHCYAFAQPGEDRGTLGYELIAVFENHPTLGGLVINDQGSEEAFTVYDHPKVLIFARSEGFDAEAARQILAAVDTSRVVNMAPNEAGSTPPDLRLSPQAADRQRQAGTWRELFNPQNLVNRSPALAVIFWWALLALVGWIVFPLVRLAFPGLADGGYPLARIVGLLLLAYLSWLLGSLGVPFARSTIAILLVCLALAAALIAYRQRGELLRFLRLHRREILWTEILALVFFLIDLGIRLGNPDLWHPFKGGEKPMDFAYFNAVLKSVSFPPYDPWFAGGYINYYYFGFVLVAIPTKLLGLAPSVAYNLIIPSLFAMLALGGYSLGYNLVARNTASAAGRWLSGPRLAGFAAMLALVLLGNLGTGKMLYQGLQRLGAPPDASAEQSPGILEAGAGLLRLLSGDGRLPYGTDSWYWDPSRAIPPGPGEPGPITEFPFFTFLYADLHAHMISLPLTAAAAAWALSWVLAARQCKPRRWRTLLLGLAVGGMLIGSLRATNTWDLPLFLLLGLLAAGAAPSIRRRRLDAPALLEGLFAAGLLLALTLLLYQPYAQAYAQGYTAVDYWRGGRSSFESYLVVHGLFLFCLFSWMTWESRQWMAATPLAELNRLRPHLNLLRGLAVLVLGGLAALLFLKYAIAPFFVLGAVWALLLLLRGGLLLEKKIVLLLIAGALTLTFAVEVVVLRGDIGRMNTVFKFYLQVWTLFSISSGAAIAWLLRELDQWHPTVRRLWSAAGILLVSLAALYPLTAAPAKIRDRISSQVPLTLDGMAYMDHAYYYDQGSSFALTEDGRAIRWMLENIAGTPVIVEASIPEYRWGSRFSKYTGLPTVIGWNWHQRQQRVAVGDIEVSQRVLDTSAFYSTNSISEAIDYLERYQVGYIIVGQLERLYFERLEPCWAAPGEAGGMICDLAGRALGTIVPRLHSADCQPLEDGSGSYACPTGGLEKFEHMRQDGLLTEVYRDGSTLIYEVQR